jgi:hypothetical protein
VWLQYPRILKRIREKGQYVVDDRYALKVERRILDDDVQYLVHEPATIGIEGGNVWVIKTFSKDAGYNMISSEFTRVNGEPIYRRIMEYQMVEGIYVPSKATTEDNFDPNNGAMQYRKTRIYKNVRLNRSIPAETFTYKNLGLKDVDIFIDKILGKEYTYQDGKLVPAKSGSFYMSEQTIWPFANLNGDCCVNREDLLIIASRWQGLVERR